MSQSERYLRQLLVAEIGLLGQRGIERATVALDGPALRNAVAVLYAERAGVLEVRAAGDGTEAALDLEALAPVAVCSNPVAREVLAGSRAAARALLAAARSGRGED